MANKIIRVEVCNYCRRIGNKSSMIWVIDELTEIEDLSHQECYEKDLDLFYIECCFFDR
jgi:hypothetical protein